MKKFFKRFVLFICTLAFCLSCTSEIKPTRSIFSLQHEEKDSFKGMKVEDFLAQFYEKPIRKNAISESTLDNKILSEFIYGNKDSVMRVMVLISDENIDYYKKHERDFEKFKKEKVELVLPLLLNSDPEY